MRYVGLVLLWTALIHPSGWANESNGWCQFDYSKPALPTANCQIPKCPVGADCVCPGGDCSPPQIGLGDVVFQEPVLLWSEKCVLGGKRVPCYEITAPFLFRLDAVDPSGISAIGFEVAIDTGDRRSFVTVWAPPTQLSNGRLETDSRVTMQSRPGQTLKFEVLKLCARDREGNQGCSLVK